MEKKKSISTEKDYSSRSYNHDHDNHGHNEGGIGTTAIVITLILCTAAQIAASWFMFTQSPASQSGETAVDALRQFQYDQAGGKEMYDLYMKLTRLKSAEQKAELESQIAALEGGGGVTPTQPAAQPGASKTLTDEEYAGVFKDSYVEGSKEAKITLIEYSDLECPYCMIQHKNGTLAQLKEKYKDQINVIYKPLNLARHPGADQKGWASLCVAKLGGTEAYSKFYSAILAGSDAERGIVYPLNDMPALAKTVGVDQAKYTECYDKRETEAIYKSYTTEALKYGVGGTPSVMVLNNTTKSYRLVEGAERLTAFETAIDAMLK